MSDVRTQHLRIRLMSFKLKVISLQPFITFAIKRESEIVIIVCPFIYSLVVRTTSSIGNEYLNVKDNMDIPYFAIISFVFYL